LAGATLVGTEASRGWSGTVGGGALSSRSRAGVLFVVCGSSATGPLPRAVCVLFGGGVVARDGGGGGGIPVAGRPLRSLPSGRMGIVRIDFGSPKPPDGAPALEGGCWLPRGALPPDAWAPQPGDEGNEAGGA